MGNQEHVNFPDKIRQEASRALSRSFKHPEIEMPLNFEERTNLLNMLTGINSTRQSLFASYDSVRFVDTVQTILSVVINDTFYSTDGEDIFTIEYNEKKNRVSDTQKKVNDSIQKFISDFQVQSLIHSILEDLLLYGEYPIRVLVSKGNKGIIDIRDDLDPSSTVGIYRLDEPLFFLERTSDSHTNYKIRSPKEIIHFSLFPTKVRIKPFDSFNYSSKNIPEHIRIGKSIIYPALQKIKQLQTIELASTIADLKRTIAPILVTVGVPANAQPEDVTEIVKKYEQHLQETYRGMPDLENPTLADLLSTVTNFRVVPNFTDGKGAIQTLDVIGNYQDVDSRSDRIRASIAMTVGMPPYYLVTGQNGTGTASKTEMLKLHTRYSRTLSSIQNAIRVSLKRLVCLHIINSGIYIDDSLINISFKNTVNTDHLDKMEYAVASAQTINDIWNTLSSILSNDEVPAKLNGKDFIDMVNTFLSAGTPIPKNLLQLIPEGSKGDNGDGGSIGPSGSASGGLDFGGGGDFGGEAELFDGGGSDAGEFSADAMQNTEEIPDADFGSDIDVESDQVDSALDSLSNPSNIETDNLSDYV